MSKTKKIKMYFCTMGRILAIDYGTKRCGIAETDPLQIIASPLTTVEPAKILDFLRDYCSKEKVESIVIGEVLRSDGTHNPIEDDIQSFIKKLQSQLPQLKIHRQDERFSSKNALESMIAAGTKKKDRRNKANIDAVSAAIILQEFLQRN